MMLRILLLLALGAGSARADDDVMMQGFYWDAPKGLYKVLAGRVPELKSAGFTAIWLPPPSKGMDGANSMGYDPYDHYDLGEFDQKGSVATRWGTKQDLLDLIAAMHGAGLRAIADIVPNHVLGADAQERSPIDGQLRWTRFRYPHPPPGGAPTWETLEARLGRAIPHGADEPYVFQKSWQDFHPSLEHPDSSYPYHDARFGEDLCQDHDYVRTGLELWGDWLVDPIGFDGFRIDYVIGQDPGFLKEWLRDGKKNGRFAVLEVWDGPETLERYVRETGASAFDFPLRFKLRDLCNDTGGGFDMRSLDGFGFAAHDPLRAVTFVDNHDTDREFPVVSDKMMAYAFILTMEGYPCVFYKDYDVYNLKPQIDRLIAVRKRLAGGSTSTLHADPHLFIAQRGGLGGAPGLVLALNNDPAEWKGAWVSVKPDWAGKVLADYAGRARPQRVAADGRVQLFAPPRGYAVYSLDGLDVAADSF